MTTLRPLLLYFWLWLLSAMESWWVLSLRALTLNVMWHDTLSAAWRTFRGAMPLDARTSIGELIVHDDVEDH